MYACNEHGTMRPKSSPPTAQAVDVFVVPSDKRIFRHSLKHPCRELLQLTKSHRISYDLIATYRAPGFVPCLSPKQADGIGIRETRRGSDRRDDHTRPPVDLLVPCSIAQQPKNVSGAVASAQFRAPTL